MGSVYKTIAIVFGPAVIFLIIFVFLSDRGKHDNKVLQITDDTNINIINEDKLAFHIKENTKVTKICVGTKLFWVFETQDNYDFVPVLHRDRRIVEPCPVREIRQ